MTSRRARLALVLLCAGCAQQTHLDSAFDALREGALVEALVQLDSIPPSDPRYPEARSTADAVERRVRVAHRLMQQALDLRAQRRDEQAAATIAAARSIWPSLPGIAALARATQLRMAALDAGGGDQSALGEVLSTSTVVDADPPTAPQGEIAPLAALAGLGDWGHVEGEVRRLLGQGRVDQAIVLLEAARAEGVTVESAPLWLLAIRVRARAVYARGDLGAAAVAWRRVLDVQEQDVEAIGFLEAIRAEQEWRAGKNDGDERARG